MAASPSFNSPFGISVAVKFLTRDFGQIIYKIPKLDLKKKLFYLFIYSINFQLFE